MVMKSISVLFVDDEEDIRYGFVDRFEDQFTLFTAANGMIALDVLKQNQTIHVVVTDIKMPVMSGLELVWAAKSVVPDIGFIVVSGHADSDDVIEALRVGARNFLRKPYSFDELEESIIKEARQYKAFREERLRQEKETAVDHFISSIDNVTYTLPNELEWVNHLAFRIVRDIVSIGICSNDERLNVALGLIEIINNAIEHGNLGLTGEEKVALKSDGEGVYWEDLRRRAAMAPYNERKVTISVTVNSERACFTVTDDGDGFDTLTLPDPTDPANLFAPSGRGIMLARTFLDDVSYNDKGNQVTLIKYRDRPKDEAAGGGK